MEINKRRRGFEPKTLMDFGSGIGTVTWAFKDVFGLPHEIMNVDESKHMNDFSRMLVTKSKDDLHLPSEYSYRFQIPREETRKYDVVASSFTLLDLPSELSRLSHIETLWNRVEENGFLVLSEVGTTAGFQSINEARVLLKNLFQENQGHIFSPCPHEDICPRLVERKRPCYFDVKFRNFPFKWLKISEKDRVFNGRFTYLIAQKGTSRSQDSDWPRLVEQPIRRRNHIVCRLCTKAGKLEEVVSTKSKHPELYKYSKQLSNRDQMRVNLMTKSIPENQDENNS